MTKLFVIYDKSMKCDTVTFIQDNTPAAGSYFFNYCTVMNRDDLQLFQIAEIQPAENNLYEFVSIDRTYICDMPEPLEEELK